MKIRLALRVAVTPRRVMTLFIGALGLIGLIETLLINPQSTFVSVSTAFSYMLYGLCLKLVAGAMYGLFVDVEIARLPRGTMFFLAMLFAVAGTVLLVPLLLGSAP
jgi:hypothetical protein